MHHELRLLIAKVPFVLRLSRFDELYNCDSKLLIRYPYQHQLICLSNQLFFCLDGDDNSVNEIAEFLFKGSLAHYSIGIFADYSVRNNKKRGVRTELNSADWTFDATQHLEGIVFPVFDFCAYTIWCPNET